MGGLCANIWICSAIYIAPKIGFGLYAICIVMGQILSSIVIDHFGLIWSDKKPLSVINIFGTLIAIIGVVMFQIPQIFNNDNDANMMMLIVYMIMSLFARMFFILLSALNRRLKIISNGTVYQSAFILFVNATMLSMIVNILIYFVQNDWFEVAADDNLKWFIFCGGLMAAFVVSMYIVCLSYIGFVATYICSIFGTLIISLIYDLFGAFGINAVDDDTVSGWKLMGIVLVLIGAMIMNIKRTNNARTK